jgi:hypothetical protein
MTTAKKPSLHGRRKVELDESSLKAIRSIPIEEVIEEARPAKIEPEQPQVVASVKRKADALPMLSDPKGDPNAAANAERAQDTKPTKRRLPWKRKAVRTKSEAKSRKGLVGKLSKYRLKPMHVALVAILLIAVIRPWLVLGLFLITLFVIVGVFLIIGFDGFWQNVLRVSRWYAKRNPERAVAVHARLDRLAMRWDAVLDRFPEGMVDSLYLPDFGELAAADHRHDEAMERRLTGMQGKGA